MECLREKLAEIAALEEIGMTGDGTTEALQSFTKDWFDKFPEDKRSRLADILQNYRYAKCASCVVEIMAYTVYNGEWEIIQDLTGASNISSGWLCPGERDKLQKTGE